MDNRFRLAAMALIFSAAPGVAGAAVCGAFVATLGGPGNGQFYTPYAVTVDGSGNVFVADSGNHRVQKFDNGGNFLMTWGSEGSGPGQFEAPSGVATDGDGHVFVADTNNERIEKFDQNGTFLTAWGSGGTGNGQFDQPWVWRPTGAGASSSPIPATGASRSSTTTGTS